MTVLEEVMIALKIFGLLFGSITVSAAFAFVMMVLQSLLATR